MSKFRNSSTGIVVSVDDSKDARFASGWESTDTPPSPEVKRSPGRPKKTDD